MARVGETGHTVRLSRDDSSILVDGSVQKYDFAQLDGGSFSLLLGDASFEIHLVESIERDGGKSFTVTVNGSPVTVFIEDHRSQIWKGLAGGRAASISRIDVRAPMPGKVIRVETRNGDKVKPGSGLCVLEAMKMENEIKSSTSGLVDAIHVEPGQSVEKGEILVTIKAT